MFIVNGTPFIRAIYLFIVRTFFTQRNEGMICAASIRLVQDSVQCSAVYASLQPRIKQFTTPAG